MARNTVVVEQAPAEESKKRKKLPIVLAGIGVLALVPLIGSTFAASITLNGSANTTEFAQGTVNTAACDNSIDVKLASTVIKDSGTPTFVLDAVTLDSIDISACSNKTITVRFADSSGNLVAVDAAGHQSFDVAIAGDGTASVTGGSTTGSTSTKIVIASDVDSSAELFHDNLGIYVHSADVAKVLLESKDS